MAIVIEKRTNLDAPIKVDSLNGGVMFTTEADAHQFVVRCALVGQELTLAGTISAKLVRADGNTVELVGSISDGAAVVTLTQDCYNVQGRFQLAVFNSVGNTKLCIYACVGYIQKAQSGNLIDGGDIIPDVEDLIADIQAAVQSIPPSYSTLLASAAGTYSASNTYSVGDYAWYNGTLYRCSTAISTAEAWTAAHWTAAVLGDDLSVIKSAIEQKAPAIIGPETGYSHKNVDKFTIKGNQYAFGNARYANNKNYIEDYENAWGNAYVTLEFHSNIVVINGTGNAANDISVGTKETDIPAGQYIFKIEPYIGDSVITNNKSFYLDLWYDGNDTNTQSKRAAVSVGTVPVSEIVAIDSHVYKMRIWMSYNTNVYKDYRLFYSLLPRNTEIIDTGETIAPDGELEIEKETVMPIVDTLMHKSTAVTIIDTKTYVDNHIPDINFVCLRPEDFGAKGDGATDDTDAFLACIEASRVSDQYAIPIRAYGSYKISQSLVFSGNHNDVVIERIDYRGNDAAVTLTGHGGKYYISYIYTYLSDGGAGIKIDATSSAFTSNNIECMSIIAKGHAILFIRASGTNAIMYNTCNLQRISSSTGDIFHANLNSSENISENVFYGQQVVATNGYFNNGFPSARFCNFCIENDIKYGLNVPAVLQSCRTVEFLNHTGDGGDDSRGVLFKLTGNTGQIYTDDQTQTQYSAIDVENAVTFQDALDNIAQELDPSSSTDEKFGVIAKYLVLGGPGVFKNVRRIRQGVEQSIPTGMSMYTFYNNKVLKPNGDWYYKIGMSSFSPGTSGGDIWPTFFDIDAPVVTINLEKSYCYLGINKFKVKQYENKKAIVYDKLGNLLFDGTNNPAGVYEFECDFIRMNRITLMLAGGTEYTIPESITNVLYDGTNEIWQVYKKDIII